MTRDESPADRAVEHAAWSLPLASNGGRAVDRWRIVNEVELAARLRAALDESGRTAWELSRRANVKLSMVDALLNGSGVVPLAALVRVARALELDVELLPTLAAKRCIGPVQTVVDDALERLRREEPAQGLP